MRTNPAADAATIRDVYDGVQAQLYELFFGQQLHVGGYVSSIDLAQTAGIGARQRGVELCCGTGASMRLLVRMRDVASMTGVELSRGQVERGRRAVEREASSDRITFVVGDATATGLPSAEADFVWGEDAWCYVPDKAAIVGEAVRLTKPGGVIAFTDWVEGPSRLSDAEMEHVLAAMTFPNLQTIDGYRSLLAAHGCDVLGAEDTGRFGPSFRMCADVIRSQFAFDVLEKVDFDTAVLDLVIDELEGLSALGVAGKLVQGRFVARTR